MRDSTFATLGISPIDLPSLTGQLQSSVPYRDLAARPYPETVLNERAERIARRDHHCHLYQHANVSEALVLLALQKDLAAAERLLSMVREAEAMVPPVPSEPTPLDKSNEWVPHFGCESHVAVAISHSALEARPPDPIWLSAIAHAVATHYCGRNKGRLHVVQQRLLVEGVICAILAGDLELASRIAGIRSTLGTSKLLFPLLKNFLMQARTECIDGRMIVRMQHAALVAECVAMLDHFRRGVGTDYRAPGEVGCYFGMIEGAYLWTWLCLLSCAPAPVLRSDWATLGDLVIG